MFSEVAALGYGRLQRHTKLAARHREPKAKAADSTVGDAACFNDGQKPKESSGPEERALQHRPSRNLSGITSVGVQTTWFPSHLTDQTRLFLERRPRRPRARWTAKSERGPMRAWSLSAQRSHGLKLVPCSDAAHRGARKAWDSASESFFLLFLSLSLFFCRLSGSSNGGRRGGLRPCDTVSPTRLPVGDLSLCDVAGTSVEQCILPLALHLAGCSFRPLYLCVSLPLSLALACLLACLLASLFACPLALLASSLNFFVSIQLRG